jgi:hypothetical protein
MRRNSLGINVVFSGGTGVFMNSTLIKIKRITGLMPDYRTEVARLGDIFGV